ncbi:hypothetical protein ACIA6E_19595 [Streptomyces sp. NPDC051815]|uniref:hypothetical protein n=1 Tax=Streptomyces sp. NPDC051815 TaxID=3365674 RepID=UPI00378C6530
MTHMAHINHDAVLRARVALLGSQTLTARQKVAAYRVLAQVSPLAYLHRLPEALYEYSKQDFAHRPDIALALRAEGLDAARRMCGLETGRAQLLVEALHYYGEQLALMGRAEEVDEVEREIAALIASAGAKRPRL